MFVQDALRANKKTNMDFHSMIIKKEMSSDEIERKKH